METNFLKDLKETLNNDDDTRRAFKEKFEIIENKLSKEISDNFLNDVKIDIIKQAKAKKLVSQTIDGKPVYLYSTQLSIPIGDAKEQHINRYVRDILLQREIEDICKVAIELNEYLYFPLPVKSIITREYAVKKFIKKRRYEEYTFQFTSLVQKCLKNIISNGDSCGLNVQNIFAPSYVHLHCVLAQFDKLLKTNSVAINEVETDKIELINATHTSKYDWKTYDSYDINRITINFIIAT